MRLFISSLSTTNGVRFVLFGESDGVLINEYLSKPKLVSTKGDIYMGGIKGLLRIDRNLPIEIISSKSVVGKC